MQQDYETYGKLLIKTGKDSLGVMQLVKASEMDTAKKDLYGDIGGSYLKMKKYNDAIVWYNKKIATGKSNANDYFGLGRAYYFIKDFVNADSAFVKITRSNAELPLGYLWRAKANVQLDPKTEKGLAKPYYESFMAKVKPEEVEKNKKDLIDANVYMGYYYVLKKDYASAKPYYQKLKELDPTNKQQKEFFNSPQGK
jgi:tetratricopeptide (TPR) repeat protein